MNRDQTLTALGAVKAATKAWAEAKKEFDAGVAKVLPRLLHEATANRMSVKQISEATGFTPTRVRHEMRRAGLDPWMGRNRLTNTAAAALERNAALIGIDPSQMDLMSPLAYLPMGRDLRKFLETNEASVTEIPDEPTLGGIEHCDGGCTGEPGGCPGHYLPEGVKLDVTPDTPTYEGTGICRSPGDPL